MTWAEGYAIPHFDMNTNPQARKTQKVWAKRGATSGSLLKIKLNEAHYLALIEAKDALAEASGTTFSATILLRRACEQYCHELAVLQPEALAAEAKVLHHRFR